MRVRSCKVNRHCHQPTQHKTCNSKNYTREVQFQFSSQKELKTKKHPGKLTRPPKRNQSPKKELFQWETHLLTIDFQNFCYQFFWGSTTHPIIQSDSLIPKDFVTFRLLAKSVDSNKSKSGPLQSNDFNALCYQNSMSLSR